MLGAIILAGGLQTRLRSSSTPKCLEAFSGKPFLYWLTSHLIASDVKPIYVLVSGDPAHRGAFDDFEAKFKRFDVHVVSSPGLGTGADLRIAQVQMLADSLEDVIIANGDTMLDLDIRALHNAHKSSKLRSNEGGHATIVLSRLPGVPHEGAFSVGYARKTEDRTISASREAFDARLHVPVIDGPVSYFGSSTGTIMLSRQGFKELIAPVNDVVHSLEGELLPRLLPHRALYGTEKNEDHRMRSLESSRLEAYDNGWNSFLDFGTGERLSLLRDNEEVVKNIYGNSWASVEAR